MGNIPVIRNMFVRNERNAYIYYYVNMIYKNCDLSW